jgi:DNA-binding XRE family transcriptional regulator
MNNVTLSNKLQNNEICNCEIINGNYDDSIRFKVWIESVFNSQDDFADKVGYSRKAINEFCNGKKDIPRALLLIMELSEENASLKQGIYNRRRKR